MNAFIYQADIYCEDCGRAIRSRLIWENKCPATPEDERTFDSDDFPKGPVEDGGGESDNVQHCAAHEDCLNGIELKNGVKVGCMLENPLTWDGAKHVQRTIDNEIKRGGIGEVVKIWIDFYASDYNLKVSGE